MKIGGRNVLAALIAQISDQCTTFTTCHISHQTNTGFSKVWPSIKLAARWPIWIIHSHFDTVPNPIKLLSPALEAYHLLLPSILLSVSSSSCPKMLSSDPSILLLSLHLRNDLLIVCSEISSQAFFTHEIIVGKGRHLKLPFEVSSAFLSHIHSCHRLLIFTLNGLFSNTSSGCSIPVSPLGITPCTVLFWCVLALTSSVKCAQNWSLRRTKGFFNSPHLSETIFHLATT